MFQFQFQFLIRRTIGYHANEMRGLNSPGCAQLALEGLQRASLCQGGRKAVPLGDSSWNEGVQQLLSSAPLVALLVGVCGSDTVVCRQEPQICGSQCHSPMYDLVHQSQALLLPALLKSIQPKVLKDGSNAGPRGIVALDPPCYSALYSFEYSIVLSQVRIPDSCTVLSQRVHQGDICHALQLMWASLQTPQKAAMKPSMHMTQPWLLVRLLCSICCHHFPFWQYVLFRLLFLLITQQLSTWHPQVIHGFKLHIIHCSQDIILCHNAFLQCCHNDPLSYKHSYYSQQQQQLYFQTVHYAMNQQHITNKSIHIRTVCGNLRFRFVDLVLVTAVGQSKAVQESHAEPITSLFHAVVTQTYHHSLCLACSTGIGAASPNAR